MKNRTAKFLTFSIVLIFALCMVVFSFMTYGMNARGAGAIDELGTMYMSDMSKQAATHFGTTIELRLSQVSALTDAVPPSSSQGPESTRVALAHNARLRGFDHLALLDEEGNFEMLYGSALSIDNSDSFLLSLQNGEENMSAGHNELGKRLVLMGIPAAYPMESGKESVGLVAALPITYISDTLSLEAEDTAIYYFIIDREGEFIVRGDEFTDESYFQRVRDRYESVEGLTAEEYIAALQDAMERNETYTSKFVIDGERRFLRCTALPFSDWYLILFMPYGILDRTVNTLGNAWGWAAVMSCLVILAAFAVVFFIYFRMTRRQVHELEEARSLAEYASKAKSEFLSNMSHDIRTPMNGIVGMTAIASANLDDPEQVQNCLKKIAVSSRHLLGLINDILDMSKIESGKLELHADAVSLREVVGSIVNMIRQQTAAKRQKFEVYVEDVACEHVLCDRVRFSQILVNLLGNAVKFTPEEGRITLSCREEPSPKGEDFVRLHIRVRDTGIGMTEEFQKKIFDAFAREDTGRVQKTEGTGLGMTITKYIVDAMHGAIEVESAPNAGTEFHVALDLGRAPFEALPAISRDILVADADETACKNAVKDLEALGCRAEYALSEEDLLRRIEERGAPYDAVLLSRDLAGMEGLSLARRLFERWKGETCLLLVTAADEEEHRRELEEAGLSGCLVKPLFRSTLYEGLTHCAEEEAPRAEKGYDFTGRRVLLAEDNDLNREIAEALLSDVGFTVESAENGQICAEMFAASPVGYYDLILMDIRMPVMSGYEATAVIRRMERADSVVIPIIAMSADAFSDDVKRCLDCGMNDHIAKPVDMEVVSRVLAKYL